MQADPRPAGRVRAGRLLYFAAALALGAALYGCALPAQPVAEPPAQDAADAPAPVAPTVVVVTSPAVPSPADELLAYADRVRGLPPAELTQEINRLGDPQDFPPRLMQLAIALGTARSPANSARAQALLQRVLAQNHPEAQALHPLARMLVAQHAESRRLDEQTERQAQQVRDAQRRIDQLNDRLEALRAIERSLPSRPAAASSGAASAPRP
jgi:alkylhydroperoxidase family enzyme